MSADRLRIDLFGFALGALILLTLAFFGARNGAAVVMAGLCVTGVTAARIAGFSNRALVPAVAGLGAILVMVWITPPADDRIVSAIAHFGGGAVVGWALAEYLRDRVSGRDWAVATLTAVVALTILWELGEFLGDLVLTTALDPNAIDSALDVVFGTVGGAGALAVAARLDSPSESDRRNAIP